MNQGTGVDIAPSAKKNVCLGINTTHLKALIKKDFMNLWRRKCFFCLFVVFPPVLALLAQYTFGDALELEDATVNGSLMFKKFKYQAFDFMPPQSSLLKDVGDSKGGKFGFSPNMMTGNPKTDCKRIMIASENQAVRDAAKLYVENTMLNTHMSLSMKPNDYKEAAENKTTILVFDSQEEMLEKAVIDERENCFGLYFKKVDTANFDYDITFQFSKFQSVDTNKDLFTPLISKPQIDDFNNNLKTAWLYPYITDFLAKYQTGFDFSQKSEWMNRPMVNQHIGYSPMQTLDFVDQDQQTFRQLADNFPTFVQFSHLFIFIYVVQSMVSEKETKARQGMKIMGLQDGTYMMAWFFHFMCLNLYNVIWQTLLIGTIFDKVSNGTLFFFFNGFSCCLFGIALCIQALSTSSKSANTFSIVFFFLSYYLNTPFDRDAPEGMLYIISVFPTIVLIRVVKLLFIYQYQTEGLEFGKGGQPFDTYSMHGGMLMLYIMTVFYVILGVYLDKVVPMEFGVALPWNFCCKKKEKYRANRVEVLSDNDIPANKKANNFEPISENLKRQLADKACMKVRGLKKEFSGKYAVKGVDLTMYNGQIFALLGHNGAGKTTTLSMLTGMLEQNEGEAEVFGFNMFDDMDRLRSMLGVCPQHDILFHYLTPQDHLRMFCSFKGTPPELIEDQVQKMLSDLDLMDQKDQQSHTLSGGQKRKLSVAISMIGNSKIIMLDEPTSGMDTTSRRRLWEMLKKNKQDKIIILTTHYMDEADILGDRIAIMTEGEVECTGSSLFLKQRYGVGYQLIIEKAVQDDLPQVEEYLRGEIPNIVKLQEVSGEISFQIPKENSSKFKEFFERFDANLERLQLRSYSVGITTLEEVFLKIGHGEDDETYQNVGAGTNPADATDQLLPKNQVDEIENYSIAQSSNKGICDQFIELSKKKLMMNARTPATYYQELIIPFVIILLFVSIGQADFLQESPALKMYPSQYDPAVLYYNSEYSQTKCPVPDPGNACASQKPNYQSTPQTFVESNMMCSACDYDKLWTEKKQIVIKPANLDSGNPAKPVNESLQMLQFEDDTYKVKDKESCNIFINEISTPKYLQEPKDPQTFTIKQLLGFVSQDMQNPTIPSPFKPAPVTYSGTQKYNSVSYVQGAATYSFVLLVNAISPHSVGIWGAYVQELILRDFLGDLSGSKKVKLKLTNDPLPLGRDVESGLSAIQGFLLAFGIGITYIVVAPSLVRNVVEEREKSQKNQMIVSGIRLPAYWMGHYVKDVVFGLILALWIIVLIAIFDIDVEDAWIFLILGAFVNPPFLYTFGFFFDKADNSGGATSFYMFLFSFIAPIVIFILQIIPSTRDIALPLKWLFSLMSPQFAIICAVYFISFKQFFGFLQPADGECGEACDYSVPDTFDERIALVPLMGMLIALVGWWIVIAFIDSSLWKLCAKVPPPKPQDMTGIDEDITNEEKQVEKSSDDKAPIKIYGAKKNYSNWVKCKRENIEAVKRVSFGLQYGECFALLGISGAGKTTMFKMITGEIQPSEGQMSIIGNNVLTPGGLSRARKYIGYCPQFDCLYPTLTVRDHLELYASLKGIDKRLRPQVVQKLMIDMGILEYENIQSQNLSGGNRRKLSVSLAIMGNPPIIFLDEPSTGVDPQAKRFMWNIVSKISREKKQSSVILTTHSMEEAEALCNKMGIMVKGEFKCFGNASHIKDKYGTGFEIEFKIRTLNEQEVKAVEEQSRQQGLIPFTVDRCKMFLQSRGLNDLANELSPDGIGFEFCEMEKKKVSIQTEEFIQWQFAEYNGERFVDMITNQFPGTEIIEHWGNSWKMKIPRGNFSIGYLFGMIEENKMGFQVSEYSVAQTSLEQIFNNFAASAELKQQFKRRNSIKKSLSGSFKEGSFKEATPVINEGGSVEMVQMAAKKESIPLNTNQVLPCVQE